MKLKKVEFLSSHTSLSKLPNNNLPEYAFIGRSNVGKSSLINMLTGQKSLAKVSSTPGKTQTINHFIVDQTWYLVDLPGYGYAKVSQKSREEWRKMVYTYIEKRENLQCVFQLIDSRLDPQKNDIEFSCKMGEKGIPFVLIFTKADKQSKHLTDKNISQYKKELLKHFEFSPQIITTSAETALGKEDVLNLITQINTDLQSV